MRAQIIHAMAEYYRTKVIALDALADLQTMIEKAAEEVTPQEDTALLGPYRAFVTAAVKNEKANPELLTQITDRQNSLRSTLARMREGR